MFGRTLITIKWSLIEWLSSSWNIQNTWLSLSRRLQWLVSPNSYFFSQLLEIVFFAGSLSHSLLWTIFCSFVSPSYHICFYFLFTSFAGLCTTYYLLQISSFQTHGHIQIFCQGKGDKYCQCFTWAGGSFIANILSICALPMLVEILIINIFLDKKLKNMEKTRYFLQNFAKNIVFLSLHQNACRVLLCLSMNGWINQLWVIVNNIHTCRKRP